MGTYSSTLLTGIVLNTTAQNPVTITSSGYIGNNGALFAAVRSTGYLTFDISNFGKIVTTATYSNHEKRLADGIDLSNGGSVLSGTGALIDAAGRGVAFFARSAASTGTLTNLGTILGNNPQGGFYSQSFPDGRGVEMLGSGVITNGTVGASSALIEGNGDGIDIAGSGTVNNFGTIEAKANALNPGYYSGLGVGLGAGGGSIITNYAGGLIDGHVAGISIGLGQAATVINSGLITASLTGTAPGGTGIVMNGDFVDNTKTGTISGVNYGIYSVYNPGYPGPPGTVVNAGLIQATGTAGVGVRLQVGGAMGLSATLTNAGTISGAGDVVQFTGGGADRLIIDPGAVFSGTVSAPGASTIELAVGNGALGTLSNFGSEYVGFSSLAFDPSARWTVEGSAVGLPGTIAGFAAGDTIDVAGFVAFSSSYTGTGLVLTDALSNSVTIGIQGTFSTGDFAIGGDGNGGTDITVALCFCRGTMIQTLNGGVAVEDLREGDLIRVLPGDRTMPVKWIGHRHIACNRHPTPSMVWPVLVSADAFGPGRPRRDVWLSPDHAVFFGDVLIPVKYLINGSSIMQIPTDEVTYYHVELPRHAVLLAEGLPAESYLDVDDRANFDNGGGVVRLFPDFSPAKPDAAAHWEANGCAPLVVTGPILQGARQYLAECARLIAVKAQQTKRRNRRRLS